MSSRSSPSETCSRSQTSAICRRTPGAARLDQDRRERDEPREALGPDRGLRAGAAVAVAVVAVRRCGEVLGVLDPLRRPAVALDQQREPPPVLGDELGRREHLRVLAEPEHPRDQLAVARVLGEEQAVAAALDRADLAVAAEVALEQPGDPLGDADLRGAGDLAELPGREVRVGARIEVGGAAEVVLGLGRVGDLAADPREAEDAQRLALVGVAEQVELAAAEEQVVGVDRARPELVALHRVVVEGDRLVAEDRGLDLRQGLGELVPARPRR